VWVGYDTPTPMLGVHGIPAVTGGTFPANIWRSYMSRATANEPRCTYRNIDAGKNKVNPELVAGPPTTTTLPPPTTTTVPGATTTTAPGATTTTVAAAPPAG
jgi:membrane peptidoglycan carboxypeptidase